MNKATILSLVEARMTAAAQERLADLVEVMVRQGYHEDEIAEFIGTATSWNREAIATAMAEAAGCLEREGIDHVRTFTMTDTQPAPRVH